MEDLAVSYHVRPWPTQVVDIRAKEDDNPYEGYWLIGAMSLTNFSTALLSSWNDKICASHRYSPNTMVVRAEFMNRQQMLQLELKGDLREWSLPLAKPDPRYVIDRVKTEAPEKVLFPSADQSQASRKLRPAMDVLSRLKYDPAFDLDDYVVGYTDRHSGIQEKAAGSWVSESTDEEWIPQGRIQYFRRVSDGKRVWDRATKQDCIFR
jgi:uncharacterized protein (UPF0248 family)